MDIETHIKIFFDKIDLDKNINFLDLFHQSAEATNTSNDFSINAAYKRLIKALFLCKYFIYASKLEGDILECGVLRGFSSYLLLLLSQKISNNTIKKFFYLIDSFEGLSEILLEDIPKESNIYKHKKGDLKADFKNVQNLFSNFQNVKILKGWIPSIFNKINSNDQYCLVHLDVDLYKPTMDSLNFFYDKAVEGGIIITDDYLSELFPGNRKAWNEFIKNKKIKDSICLPSGQAVIIKK